MEILNVKVEKDTKKKLERLAKRKGYKNMSEAVRKTLEEHFKEHPELMGPKELNVLIKKADEMSDKEYEKIATRVFRSRKTAAELVTEMRGGS